MDSTEIGLLCVFMIGCVILSAFFTRIETALAESRKSRLEHYAEGGDDRAQKILHMLDAPETLIAASQIGSNRASRFFSVSFFESLSPAITRPRGRITAAA